MTPRPHGYLRSLAWMERGACFAFPLGAWLGDDIAERGHERTLHVGWQRSICAQRPVLADCRTWALTSPDPAQDLLAGGMTHKERKAARRATIAVTAVAA